VGASASRGRVLVTGGAGFIGSHLVDRLIECGYSVRILDALLSQVHPDGPPSYLNREAEFLHGDVRDAEGVRASLIDVDTVVHLAAAVGVGQSMYDVASYSSVNVLGTATLLEVIVKQRRRPRRLIVASSMSIYGEGLYECAPCGPQNAVPRPLAQLERRDWVVHCPACGGPMEPHPTPETKLVVPTSVYALNKRDQEEMVLLVGRTLDIPSVALRFFNVYGKRQALSNPYTGVGAIFSGALLNGRAPLVFEDGLQMRDFTHVSDVVSACMLAIEKGEIADGVFNVGTGHATTLLELVTLLSREISAGSDIKPEIVGRFREGDIRACYADVTKAREILGFSSRVTLSEGVKELASWVAGQSSVDRSRKALEELEQYRLIR
jgi:dTDP-L-rhamnose 4-epimerase